MTEETVNSITRREHVSPRQLALALGVSESSVKRWCDQGALRATRTGGGHRRITLAAVWQFLQQTDRQLIDPGALGLFSSGAVSPRTLPQAVDELVQALLGGEMRVAERVVLDQFLMARRPLAVIFDDIVTPAFEAIGEQWESGALEVYQERRASESMLSILTQLHELIAVSPHSPIAMGATLEGDHYQLATKMAELVLRQCGWEATTIGSHLPAATLQAALMQIQPQLLWLSCSHIARRDEFMADFRAVWSTAKHIGASFVVGGRALTPELRAELPFAHYCQNMRHLEQLSPELLRLHKGENSVLRASRADE